MIPHQWCATSCENLAYTVPKSASTCREITEESTAKGNMLVYTSYWNLALGLSSNYATFKCNEAKWNLAFTQSPTKGNFHHYL